MQIVDGPQQQRGRRSRRRAKGLIRPRSRTGHRERSCGDGVPEDAAQRQDVSRRRFFDSPGGPASPGVQGRPRSSRQAPAGPAKRVNDALAGAVPNPATDGPPKQPEHRARRRPSATSTRAFTGDLISFHAERGVFAPIGTTITDVTFHVAGSTATGTVVGMGVVFVSVDNPVATTMEFFDEKRRQPQQDRRPAALGGSVPESRARLGGAAPKRHPVLVRGATST